MKKLVLSLLGVGMLVTATMAQTSTLFTVQIQKTGTEDGVDVSSDDAEQENSEMDKLFDDDLDAGWEGDDFNTLVCGMRFTGIDINQGSTIDSAWIEVYSHEIEKDPAKITIVGEASDNPPTFSLDSLITDRSETSSSVVWNVEEDWEKWTMYRTVDLSSIVQEIINRKGWTPGNALALHLKGENQGASTEDNARDMESFENEEDPEEGGDGENHPERAPRLVIYYTPAPNKFEIQIQSTEFDNGVPVSSDDAEQENNEMDKLFDDDLDAGWEGDDLNVLTAGLRFRDVAIPQGAFIDSAWIEVFSHEIEKDEATILISGEASDNAPTFTLDSLLTERTKTEASVTWEVTADWEKWTMYRTDDISTIVQEIVNRNGWQSGNALAIYLAGQIGSASEEDNARDMESFENEEDPEEGGDGKNHPERAPRLVVYYTTSAVGLPELKEQKRLALYPNPVTGDLIRIDLSVLDHNKGTIQITDMTGAPVMELPLTEEVDVTHLSANQLYILKVIDEDNAVTSQKFLVK